MTPTCKTCGAKFPGKDVCKQCGADPAATPDPAVRIAQAMKRLGEEAKKGAARLMHANRALAAAVDSEEYRVYERRARRAKMRSINNKPRQKGHGRQ